MSKYTYSVTRTDLSFSLDLDLNLGSEKNKIAITHLYAQGFALEKHYSSKLASLHSMDTIICYYYSVLMTPDQIILISLANQPAAKRGF